MNARYFPNEALLFHNPTPSLHRTFLTSKEVRSLSYPSHVAASPYKLNNVILPLSRFHLTPLVDAYLLPILVSYYTLISVHAPSVHARAPHSPSLYAQLSFLLALYAHHTVILQFQYQLTSHPSFHLGARTLPFYLTLLVHAHVPPVVATSLRAAALHSYPFRTNSPPTHRIYRLSTPTPLSYLSA